MKLRNRSRSLPRPPTCRAGGFCFASSLQHDAAVFWCQRRCSHVLPVIAEPPLAAPAMPAFDPARLPCRAIVLRLADGSRHLLLQHAGRQLQLAIAGAELDGPVLLRTDAIWPAGQAKHRLWALECLDTLLTQARLPARLFAPEARGRRLRFVLQALDGSLAKASYRDIAAAVLGEPRVRADWADPRNHLRDRIRRAVRRGHAFVNGGYADLLG
ncbi:hypothetical protein CK215_28645 [Mesorhizobium sp. WSM3864]|uniref:DNA -binding domain-containing protein n=1 Tax=Mesorhizobium sp. WSM3864 TaxID=2029404 RepID=UPI000BB07F72|nr:DUF2285 domain-containing protein [Mesorhizobium sp. WSM3864]PBB89228.1 hypothetical protein CK215_28645 [Mesorhizobium sp. WSM3864]